jgi:putative endonuclease
MFHVYVLYSEKFQKIYIGMTSNLEERLKSHNELGTKGWTIKFRSWQIVYQEQFEEKKNALTREKQFKSAKGREFIRALIKNR